MKSVSEQILPVTLSASPDRICARVIKRLVILLLLCSGPGCIGASDVFAQGQPVAGPGAPRSGSAAPRSAASSSKPGSVLFFHRFTSASHNPADVNTLLTLTNTNPRDSVAVRIVFNANCLADQRTFTLGPNQTRTLLMSQEKPGASGYAIATAVNAAGIPTQFNWLIGSATLRETNGREAWYNAFSVAKRTAGATLTLSPTIAEMYFDGNEYDRLPRMVAVDNLPNQAIEEGISLNTEVTVYSPSLQPTSDDYTPVKLTATVYDQKGKAYSELVDNICGLATSVNNVWFETPVNDIVTAGRPGWATFASNDLLTGDPLPVLGMSLTESIGGAAQHNARNMHVLEWLDEFKMKFEVFPVLNPPAESLTQDQPEATGNSEGVSENKAGSILVFPRFVTADGGNTQLNLTNTDPTRATRVRLFFSNLAPGSELMDKIISLGANQTTTLDLSGIVPDERGWVLAMAIGEGGRPAQFNRLIGSAQVFEGVESGAAPAAYNALSAAKNSPGLVERNADAKTASLLFDDINYDRLPATAALSAVPGQDDNNTTLGFARAPVTLLNGVNARGSISAVLYDDNFNTSSTTIGRTEVRISEQRANNGPQSFTSILAKGHRGWLKLVVGTPLFAWSNTQTITQFAAADGGWSGGISGGGNLHYLTAADSFQITAPATNPGNTSPVAVAEPLNAVIEARSGLGTIVRLDASASYDDDLDPLTYRWYDNDRPVTDSRVTDLRLSPGFHLISLNVTDNSGASSVPYEQLVEVRDTTPPSLSGIPASITRHTTSLAGAAVNYQLPVAYDMVDGWISVGSTNPPGSHFPLGSSFVTFTARDRAGNTATAFLIVNVVLDSAESQTGGEPGSITPVLDNLNDQYIPAGTVKDILLQANDPDGDQVFFSLIGSHANAELVNIDAAARQATLRIHATAGAPAAELRISISDNRRQTFRTLPFRIVVSDIPNDETGSGRKLTNRPPNVIVEPLPAAIQAMDKDGAEVMLDGSRSTDPDGDNLNFVWTDNGFVIAQGAKTTVKLPVGQHSIVLIVSDGNGGVSSSAPLSVEVLPRSLRIISATPRFIQRGTKVLMTITGEGIEAGTQVRFSKAGIDVTRYVTIEEDRIVVELSVSATTFPGTCDVFLSTPTGKSARLRSGCYIQP